MGGGAGAAVVMADAHSLQVADGRAPAADSTQRRRCNTQRCRCNRQRRRCNRQRRRCNRQRGRCNRQRGRCNRQRGRCNRQRGRCDRQRGRCDTCVTRAADNRYHWPMQRRRPLWLPRHRQGRNTRRPTHDPARPIGAAASGQLGGPQRADGRGAREQSGRTLKCVAEERRGAAENTMTQRAPMRRATCTMQTCDMHDATCDMHDATCDMHDANVRHARCNVRHARCDVRHAARSIAAQIWRARQQIDSGRKRSAH
jgi:hypothetical protein